MDAGAAGWCFFGFDGIFEWRGEKVEKKFFFFFEEEKSFLRNQKLSLTDCNDRGNNQRPGPRARTGPLRSPLRCR